MHPAARRAGLRLALLILPLPMLLLACGRRPAAVSGEKPAPWDPAGSVARLQAAVQARPGDAELRYRLAVADPERPQPEHWTDLLGEGDGVLTDWCLPDGAVERLTEVSHYVAEVANVAPDSRQPYAGRYAFTHKAGLHASGIARLSQAYEHIEPETVGNHRGIVASDLGGAATLRMKAAEFELDLDTEAIPALLDELKDREARGYTFEVADASLELLMRRVGGWRQPFFRIESYRVHVEERVGDGEAPLAEATVKVRTNGTKHIESAEGHGPVGALDNALRKALVNEYPELAYISLEDFRVRVLDETHGTGAVVRVLIDTSNGQRGWTTVGVSENIIEASWEALVDGYLYGLLHPRTDES